MRVRTDVVRALVWPLNILKGRTLFLRLDADFECSSIQTGETCHVIQWR